MEAPVVIPPTWDGFHLGISGGFIRGEKQTLRLSGLNPQEQALIDFGGLNEIAFSKSGGTIGGGFGYDKQLGRGNGVVIGIAADMRAVGLDHTRNATVVAGYEYALTARQRLDYLGTLRGRLGYAFGPMLVYGTGGFAFGGASASGQTEIVNVGLYDAGRHSGVETGAVYGGGIEAILPRSFTPSFLAQDRLSMSVEYLRYDLGTRAVTIAGTGPFSSVGETAVARFRTQGQMLNLGLNYRFNAFD